jgi:hypothetical protein
MNKITPALLHELYTQSDKSGLQVAKELGIGRTTLGRYLKKFGIPMKNLSEIMTGRKLSPEHKAKVVKTLRNGSQNENPNWKGGRTTTSQGYVWIKSNEHPNKNRQGYVLEHRLVIEKKLGRYLEKSEHVHHINGVKTDNRIENLKIVTRSEHTTIHFNNTEMKKKVSDRMKKLYSDPVERQKKSEEMKRARSRKYWSTKKIKI